MSVINNTFEQEHRQNFGSGVGEHPAKNYSTKTFEIFLENLYKIRTKF